jgi:hypothetical protein
MVRPSKLIWGGLKALWSAMKANPWASMSVISGWGWGIALLLPGNTLDRPTYKYMHAVAEEEYWTVLFLMIAALQTWRLFRRTTPALFRYEVLLKSVACATWTFVAVACYFSQWPLAAAMSDAVAVAFAAWVDLIQVQPCKGCHLSGSGCCDNGCFLARSHDAD